jgi:hypothetical protein
MAKTMDRKLLSGEDHEIRYMAKALGTTQEVIRRAHSRVGRSRKMVVAFVMGRQKRVTWPRAFRDIAPKGAGQ